MCDWQIIVLHKALIITVAIWAQIPEDILCHTKISSWLVCWTGDPHY